MIHNHQLRPFCFAVSFDTIMELSKSNERWGGGLPPAAYTHCYARLDSANARKYRSIHADRGALVRIDIIYFRIYVKTYGRDCGTRSLHPRGEIHFNARRKRDPIDLRRTKHISNRDYARIGCPTSFNLSRLNFVGQKFR